MHLFSSPFNIIHQHHRITLFPSLNHIHHHKTISLSLLKWDSEVIKKKRKKSHNFLFFFGHAPTPSSSSIQPTKELQTTNTSQNIINLTPSSSIITSTDSFHYLWTQPHLYHYHLHRDFTEIHLKNLRLIHPNAVL